MTSDPISRLSVALEGRYRVERELGEGGMATVYLADDVKHGRKVALKVLKPALAAVIGADRFLAEIKTTANLQHPNILPLFDSGEADGFLYYVMPFMEGESLRQRLDREHELPVSDAVRIATNVAEALDYAHAHGVIHRDIKPANILLQAGKPVVSDFGIALAVSTVGGGRLTETGLSVGTPSYMSPEQATGESYLGPATDIFSLGCVLHEMLAGEPPFTGSTAQAVLGKILMGEVTSTFTDRASVPAHVDAVVARALERLPADRFTRAADMARALDDPGFRHRLEATPGAMGGKGSWNRLTVGFAVATAVTSALALWFATQRRVLEPPSVTRFTIPVGEDRVYGDLAGRPSLDQLAISSDGETIVFKAIEDGVQRLYRRPLDDEEIRPIEGTDGGELPFFSPTASGWASPPVERCSAFRWAAGLPRPSPGLAPAARAGATTTTSSTFPGGASTAFLRTGASQPL
jgi:serine/threonine-protein kinase